MDDDGVVDEPVRIAATVTVRGAEMRVDFSGSATQVPGNINAVAAITESAVRYVLRCIAEALLATPLPAGGGAMPAVTIVAPPGTVVNARPPAAVAAGNVETSQRIVDVVFRALAQALPEPKSAAIKAAPRAPTSWGSVPLKLCSFIASFSSTAFCTPLFLATPPWKAMGL